jgi:hypothetical protein
MSTDITITEIEASLSGKEAAVQLQPQPVVVQFALPVSWHVIVYVAFYGTQDKQVSLTGNGQTQVRNMTQSPDVRHSYMTITNAESTAFPCQIQAEWFGPSASLQVVSACLFDIVHPAKDPVSWEAEEYRINIPTLSDESISIIIVLQEGVGPIVTGD